MRRPTSMIVLWIATTGASQASDLAPFFDGAPPRPTAPLVSDSEGNAFVPLPEWPATIRPPAQARSAVDPATAKKIRHAVAEDASPTAGDDRSAGKAEVVPRRPEGQRSLPPDTSGRRRRR